MSGGAAEYSMREVNQQAARVIREVTGSGQPAVITRYGRPAFLILPVPESVREQAVAAVIAAAVPQEQKTGNEESR